MEQIGLYTDAIACLKQTLIEGEKSSNVDIQLMLSNIQRCQNIVKTLQQNQIDTITKDALEKLGKSLDSHADTLIKKISQLNSTRTNRTVQSQTVNPSDSAVCESSAAHGQKEERRSAIEDTILSSKKIRFADVAGLTDAKQALTEAIIMPLHYPHLFTGGRKPWKRILLYGPPGTGKSRLAQAVAAEINSTFYCVSSADLVSSWVGESEKLIRELFCHATGQPGRSVIFIDEIDSICRRRNSREEEHTRRIKTELLKQMEGADNSEATEKIFLLCATNCPWELDSAFLRRFQKRIYIPLPDREARLELIKIHSKESVNLQSDDWSILATRTEGYSGSDIAAFTLGALFEPVRELQITKHWKPLPDGTFSPCDVNTPGALSLTMSEIPAHKVSPRDVLLVDFLKALQTHRKTVTEDELKRFMEFTESFGESG